MIYLRKIEIAQTGEGVKSAAIIRTPLVVIIAFVAFIAVTAVTAFADPCCGARGESFFRALAGGGAGRGGQRRGVGPGRGGVSGVALLGSRRGRAADALATADDNDRCALAGGGTGRGGSGACFARLASGSGRSRVGDS